MRPASSVTMFLRVRSLGAFGVDRRCRFTEVTSAHSVCSQRVSAQNDIVTEKHSGRRRCVVRSLFSDQERQTCLFIFPDGFDVGCQANQRDNSKLSCPCSVSRQMCARERGGRGCVRNKATCVKDDGACAFRLLSRHLFWSLLWWEVGLFPWKGEKTYMTLSERCDFGNKYWGFCYWNAVSMHLLLGYLQTWSLGSVFKGRVTFFLFRGFLFKFYSDTPWWNFFQTLYSRGNRRRHKMKTWRQWHEGFSMF